MFTVFQLKFPEKGAVRHQLKLNQLQGGVIDRVPINSPGVAARLSRAYLLNPCVEANISADDSGTGGADSIVWAMLIFDGLRDPAKVIDSATSQHFLPSFQVNTKRAPSPPVLSIRQGISSIQSPVRSRTSKALAPMVKYVVQV